MGIDKLAEGGGFVYFFGGFFWAESFFGLMRDWRFSHMDSVESIGWFVGVFDALLLLLLLSLIWTVDG